MARKPVEDPVVVCERCAHPQPVPRVPTLDDAARRLPPSAFRPSLPKDAGKVDEMRLEFSSAFCGDERRFDAPEGCPETPYGAGETLEQCDWSTSYVPAGLGILPKGEAFALDLRFRKDVGREEAKALVRAIREELSEENIDGWYDRWERQAREHAWESRELAGLPVSCLCVPFSASDALAAALDAIPDYARARLVKYWRDLHESTPNAKDPFPALFGSSRPSSLDTLPRFGTPTPVVGAFHVSAVLDGVPPGVALSAGLRALARAYVAIASGMQWYGLTTQVEEADRIAADWGADLAALSLGTPPSLAFA